MFCELNCEGTNILIVKGDNFFKSIDKVFTFDLLH